jgi:predicted small metal-binding protein
MIDKIDDIVIPILRNIQADVSGLKADVSSLKTDVSMLKESVRRIDARIASMDSHMAGFHGAQNWQSDLIDNLRARIEKLEERDKPKPPAE